MSIEQRRAEVVEAPRSRLGEGPRWFGDRLHWVDIHGRRHHALDVRTGGTVTEQCRDEVTLVLPRAGGGLLLAVGATIVLRDPDGRERVLCVLSGDPAHRCNDGVCDPEGRLYVGTMRRDASGREGRLHRVDPDGHVTTVADGCGIPNGIAFDVRRRRMWFADSADGGVDVWDLDVDGLPVGRRRLVDVAGPGVPDGLALDDAGHAWVAVHGSGVVHRYRPDGALVGRITVDAARTTACAFGGASGTDLYVTTAQPEAGVDRDDGDPLAGSVFVVPDVGCGLPVVPFAG